MFIQVRKKKLCLAELFILAIHTVIYMPKMKSRKVVEEEPAVAGGNCLGPSLFFSSYWG